MERKQVSEDKHQSDSSCFIGIWKIMSYMKSYFKKITAQAAPKIYL